MAIIGSQVIRFYLEYSYLGVNAVNKFSYAPVDDTVITTAEKAALAFESLVLPTIAACLSTKIQFNSIKAQLNAPFGGSSHIIGLSGVNGTRTGFALPPQAAYSLAKYPQLSTQEGSDVVPFRQGAIRLMGVSESDQDDGFVKSTQLTLLDTLGANLLELEIPDIDDVSQDYVFFMDRPPLTPEGPPAAVCFVQSFAAVNTVRHQNTRSLY